ncbi:MAG: GHKL domain-containing protein [Flavobacteriales bacterium]|nr:GHKL domain-containing protein [Flavobacteriales bacterium]
MQGMVRSIVQLAIMVLPVFMCRAQDTIAFPQQAERPVGALFQFLEDSIGSMSLKEAVHDRNYRPLEQDVPNLGTSGSVFWARAVIKNNSEKREVVLSLPHPEIDLLDVYILERSAPVHLAHVGQSVPRDQRIASDPEFLFRLPIPSGASLPVLLRVQSNKQLQLPLILTTDSEFDQHRAGRNLFLGGYMGIMLVMAIYNLFVFFSFRERSYFLYVVYILFVCCTQLAFIGIGPFYLWAGSVWISSKASLILTLLTAMAASEFIRSFLRTKEYIPKIDGTIPYFYGLFLLNIAIYLFVSPTTGYKVAQLISGMFAFTLLGMIIAVWRKGVRQAGFMLLAWSAFLTGTMVFVMKDMGILPYNSITIYTMPVGSAIEGVLLSFGLADRINILRREKERSQADALRISRENERIIREQNVILDQKVKERTLELQESNEHLKRTQTQLVNAEKMASLGQLTAGIAHEINNPVNFITSNIPPLRRNLDEMLQILKAYRSMGPDATSDQIAAIVDMAGELDLDESLNELPDIIASIEEGADRTTEIVRGLRNFSRLDEDSLKPADINEGIRSTLTVLGSELRDQVEIELDLEPLPQVECFPGKLNQVFMNMLNNAMQATRQRYGGDRKGHIRVRTSATDQEVTIRIEDDGTGMTPEVVSRIYEPFFTTKDVGEGTGLGLSIAYGIIERHHGRIGVESTPGVGTIFQVSLPIHQPRVAQKRA